jgi:hypothetical protein
MSFEFSSPVRSVADVDRLPWAGSFLSDWPILVHVESTVRDCSLPRELRKAISDRAFFLMMGEEPEVSLDADFDEYLGRLV